jgi:L-seryl-tRNA(Ser) seleniumtransferase
MAEIEEAITDFVSPKLRPLINATGIIIHTNLGRAPLSERAVQAIAGIGGGYSNLEYNLSEGRRGKRYENIRWIITELTGAEDALVVNNNAGAVLLCLAALSAGREAIVSRGELVEIGGSFRIPDVMVRSGAVLREVGTTNKTHLRDYADAISEETGLLLKVHQSNFRIVGFTEDVSIGKLGTLGRERGIPVMFDLGSGCLFPLDEYGIRGEPLVKDVLEEGADIVTFSGDKLLGGPQAGIIAGRKDLIEEIARHPLTRALRPDKLTLSALEATLIEYLDPEKARENIPVLRMLTEAPESVKKRARKIYRELKKRLPAGLDIRMEEDFSQAGGGSLPEINLATFVVTIKPESPSLSSIEERLRRSSPPVICRIHEDRLILDARTIGEGEIKALGEVLAGILC